MAESIKVKIKRDGLVTILDGAGSPLSYTVAYEDGDFSFNAAKDESLWIEDRGVIVGERAIKERMGSLKFSVHMREFRNASAATIVDVIKKTGAWASATSLGTAAYESFMHKLTFTVDDGTDSVVTFGIVKLDYDFAEGDPNKINVTGEVVPSSVTYSGPA